MDGLGLSVLYEDLDHDAFAEIIMLGLPGALWHLELTNARVHHVMPVPTEEDLLVLYLGAPAEPALIERLQAHGGTVVPARNPYWERWGSRSRIPTDTDWCCLSAAGPRRGEAPRNSCVTNGSTTALTPLGTTSIRISDGARCAVETLNDRMPSAVCDGVVLNRSGV